MAAQSFPPAFPPAFPPVLLTRPAAASARFADALRRAFGPATTVFISPLMEPEFLRPLIPPEQFDALILTSETGAGAARRLSAEGASLPTRAFCVGDRTANAAVAAGFAAQSARGDAQGLVRLIDTTDRHSRFLHLHGQETTGDIVQQLGNLGIFACGAVVYRQRPLTLTPEAEKLLAGRNPVIVPLFSPRSADLLGHAGPVAAPLLIAALSAAVADRAATLHPQRMIIVQRPDADAMLRAIESLGVGGPLLNPSRREG